MSEIDVPIISLADFISGADRAKVVAEVKNACLRCGFFMVEGHGVDAGVIDEAWRACRSFFDCSVEVKETVPSDGDYPYGYVGIQGEIAGGSFEYGAADMKESFSVCLGGSVPDPRMPAPRWPKGGPDSFPPAVTAYYKEMEKLARILLRIFALALDLEENFFDSYEDSHWSALRCLNYPNSEGKPFKPGQMRIAAHTDYGTLTILRADNAPGGLQVQMKDGSWRDVVFPSSSTFTINLGDLMQRWTNDAWKSTMHRVVPPPVSESSADGASNEVPDNRRQSVAFFHNLNRDAVCSVFPSCVTSERPAKYPPVNAFDHLMSRHQAAVGYASRLESGDTEGAAQQKVGGADITSAAWAKAAEAEEEGGGAAPAAAGAAATASSSSSSAV